MQKYNAKNTKNYKNTGQKITKYAKRGSGVIIKFFANT